jgi:hypothetical protein
MTDPQKNPNQNPTIRNLFRSVGFVGLVRNLWHRLTRQKREPESILITFVANTLITLGEAREFTIETSTSFHFQTVGIICNAYEPGFVLIDEISVDGVSISIDGVSLPVDKYKDGYALSPVPLTIHMFPRFNVPPFGPDSRIHIRGRTTDLVPPGFHKGSSFLLSFMFRGFTLPFPRSIPGEKP